MLLNPRKNYLEHATRLELSPFSAPKVEIGLELLSRWSPSPLCENQTPRAKPYARRGIQSNRPLARRRLGADPKKPTKVGRRCYGIRVRTPLVCQSCPLPRLH